MASRGSYTDLRAGAGSSGKFLTWQNRLYHKNQSNFLSIDLHVCTIYLN